MPYPAYSGTVVDILYVSYLIVVGDFNGDGIPDLAIAKPGAIGWVGWAGCDGDNSCTIKYFNGTVEIMLGNGDGTFTSGGSVAVGTGTAYLAVGDFNGDGILDLAVVDNCGYDSACASGSAITFFRGNGDGTFGKGVVNPISYAGGSLMVADFNGDGIPDLVEDGVSPSPVTVYLGNRDGTFGPAIPTQTKGNVAVGDFNGDGIPDLAVAGNSSPTITILLGNGDGTFATAETTPATGGAPSSVVVGDFNRDGILDLAVPNGGNTYGTYTAGILLGNGDGTFTAATASPATTGSDPVSIAVGDFNGDGIPDLAVANAGSNPGLVEVLLGKGDGTFTANLSSLAGDGPFSIVTGNFIGDGSTDLAVANWIADTGYPSLVATNTVTILLPGVKADAVVATGVAVLPLASGVHQVVATYTGDSNFKASTSSPTDLTAAPGTPKVSLAVSPTPTTSGTSVTLTATVTGSALAPTGTVTFDDDRTYLGTATESNGVATLVTSSFAAGSNPITARYSGDGNYNQATSPIVALAVSKGTPTVALASSANSSAKGATVTFKATFTGTGLTPTGSVTFLDGTVQMGTSALSGSGVATYSTSTLAVGTHSITASYSGDANYAVAISAALSEVVSKAVPAINLAPSANPATYGTSVTLTATLTGSGAVPTGTVTFFDGTTPLGVGTLNGSGVAAYATKSLAGGQNSITASYPGDSNYAPTTSAAVSLTVNKATPVISVTSSAASTVYGASVTLTATIAGSGAVPTGTVTFFNNTQQLVPVSLNSSGVATYATSLLAVGASSIKASYSGDSNYGVATSAAVSLTVTKATPTVSMTPPATSVVYGTSATITTTVTGSGGVPAGSVTLFNGTTELYKDALNSSGVVTFPLASLAGGKYSITASYSGDNDYNAAPSTAISVTVNAATPTISWAAPAAITYGTALTAFQLDATSTALGNFAYSPAVGTVLDAGAHTLKATFTPNNSADYTTATASVTVTVKKATPSNVLTSTANPAYVLNPIIFTATLSSSAGTPTGKVTFFDGTTQLGTGTLNGSGVATYTTSALAAGSHSITAAYAGDSNFLTVTSSALAETIQDFTVGTTGGGTTTVTASPGGQAAYTFALDPPSGMTFAGPISFTVTGLPSGATASFSPNPVLAGAGTTTVTMTVTLPSTAAAHPLSRPFGGGALPVALGLILLPFAFKLRRASRRLNRTVCLLALGLAGLALAAGLTGCGGGGGATSSTPQSYTLTITATSGGLSHSTTVNLTVE